MVICSMKYKNYFPVNLDIDQKPCLVVGGGDIALRKVRSLLSFGAVVTVVGLEVKQGMARLISRGKVNYIKSRYQAKQLEGVFLVIAATDVEKVNTRVARDAMKRNILVNVVDVPALCTFIVPAVVRRGPIVVGISTGGCSPVFAQHQRKKCEKCITPAQGTFVAMLGAVRPKVQARFATMAERKAVYQRLIDSPVLSLLEAGKSREAGKILADIINSNSTYNTKGST